MADDLVSVLGTVILLAIVTTLVLPGRQTPGVLMAFFSGLANAIRAAMGQSK